MMRNEKKQLYVSIEQLSRQTEWAGWFKEVLLAAAQVSLYRIETWEPFKLSLIHILIKAAPTSRKVRLSLIEEVDA